MKKLLRLLRYDWPLHFVLLFTNWLPDNVIFLRLRGWFASPFFGSCGKNLRLGRNITFYNPSKMSFGNDIYIAYGCWLNAGDTITIKDEVLLGPYCVIVSSDHTLSDNSFRHSKPKHAPIEIKKGAWLGAKVVITAGSIIGEGSAIAAGAVVTENVIDRCLVGGVPAKTIKYYNVEQENEDSCNF